MSTSQNSGHEWVQVRRLATSEYKSEQWPQVSTSQNSGHEWVQVRTVATSEYKSELATSEYKSELATSEYKSEQWPWVSTSQNSGHKWVQVRTVATNEYKSEQWPQVSTNQNSGHKLEQLLLDNMCQWQHCQKAAWRVSLSGRREYACLCIYMEIVTGWNTSRATAVGDLLYHIMVIYHFSHLCRAYLYNLCLEKLVIWLCVCEWVCVHVSSESPRMMHDYIMTSLEKGATKGMEWSVALCVRVCLEWHWKPIWLYFAKNKMGLAESGFVFLLAVWGESFAGFFMTQMLLQWGTANAEIKHPADGSLGLSKVPSF